MSRSLIVAAASLTFVLACGTAEGDQPLRAPAAADTLETNGYRLVWAVAGDMLDVTMSAPTTGWVAVGFHTEGAMKNADIVIGYVSAGQAAVRDDFGTDYTRHASDISLGGTDDVSSATGTETGGRTSISFSIPLSSGDANDHELVPGSTVSIIMANGSNGDDSFTGMHQWAGVAEIEL
jgi:hypothetical protein